MFFGKVNENNEQQQILFVVDPLPVTGRRALVIPSRQPGGMLQGIPSR